MENLCTLFFTLDIIFNFMRVPDDRDINSENKVTHSTIGLRYIKGGKFFVDVIATVPLYLITYVQGEKNNWAETESSNQYGVFLKLVRLVRISRLINLLDPSAVHKIGEILFSGQTRQKKVELQLMIKNVYQVFRLILLTVITTYFTGCIFYFVSSMQNDETMLNLGVDTFIDANSLEENAYTYQLITSCYFSITTLSTVGYGELFPISKVEKCLGMVIMLLGVGFFSYIMGSFIDIISNMSQS